MKVIMCHLPALTQWFDCMRAGLQQNAWSR